MKKSIFITVVLATTLLVSCRAPLPVKNPVTREAPKEASQWTVLGSVRVEVFSKLPINPIPYDKLLKQAHEAYGAKVDVIEIKEEKFKLDAITKAKLIKDKVGMYSYQFIYNALVIEYK